MIEPLKITTLSELRDEAKRHGFVLVEKDRIRTLSSQVSVNSYASAQYLRPGSLFKFEDYVKREQQHLIASHLSDEVVRREIHKEGDLEMYRAYVTVIAPKNNDEAY